MSHEETPRKEGKSEDKAEHAHDHYYDPYENRKKSDAVVKGASIVADCKTKKEYEKHQKDTRVHFGMGLESEAQPGLHRSVYVELIKDGLDVEIFPLLAERESEHIIQKFIVREKQVETVIAKIDNDDIVFTALCLNKDFEPLSLISQDIELVDRIHKMARKVGVEVNINPRDSHPQSKRRKKK